MATIGADAEAVEVRQESEPVTSGGPAFSVAVEAAFEGLSCRRQDEDIERTRGRIGSAHNPAGKEPAPAGKEIIGNPFENRPVHDIVLQHRHPHEATRTAALATQCALGDVPAPSIGLCGLWRAVEHSSAAVIITDAAGRIEYVNPCFTKVTGYRLDEIAGKTPGILKSGRTSESDYRELWSTIRRGEDWHGEFCNRRKDGSLYWGSASISPVKGPDGRITHFIAMQVDVSARKQAEEELRVNEQRFRSLVETSMPGICIERNGKPLFVNRSFADIFGYDRPADIIQLGSLEPLYVQGDLTRVTRCRQMQEKGCRTSLQHEVRGVKRDGSIIWLHTQTKIVSWSGGAALQTSVVDITLRKNYEDRLVMRANHDPLTELPNRALALDRLTSAIVGARTWYSGGRSVHRHGPLQKDQRHTRPRRRRPGSSASGATHQIFGAGGG